MRKVKYEYIPIEMVKIMETELRKLQNERRRNNEPTRVEAWRRVADKMTRQLFKKKKV